MADSSGLGALSKETIAAVAADPTSSDILANMQQRANELNSPWRKFQSDLDLMVARGHYNPEPGVSQIMQQRNLDEQQLQNTYSNMANINMMRQQIGNTNETFKNLQPQSGTTSQGMQGATDGGQGNTAFDPSGLTQQQLLVLNSFRRIPDGGAKFNEALKEFVHENSKIALQSKLNPERYSVVHGTITGYDPGGKQRALEDDWYKYEIEDWARGIPPARAPWLKKENPSVQKKANGGAIRHMADGNLTAPMDNSAPQDIGQQTQSSFLPQAGTAPVMPQDGNTPMSKILATLMGAKEAQAAPQASVTVSPYTLTPKEHVGAEWQGREQQSGLQQEQAKNQAELESLKQEREAAGKFIADLQNQSFSPTTLQKAQEIIDMSKEHPSYFGYGYKNDPIGIMMGLTGATEDPAITDEASRNTSRLASIKQQFQGESAMEKRSRLNQLAKELGIAYEKEQFGGTGSKMGAQLTTISQAAKGLGANFPASQNIAQALTIQLVHERNSELAKEWNAYKGTVKNADPYVFMMAPKTQAILNKWNLELNNQVSKVMNKPKEGSEDKDVDGNPIVFKNGQWMRVKK